MKPLTLIALLAAMAVPSYADTTIIYQDSYSSGSNSAPTDINGATPDVQDIGTETYTVTDSNGYGVYQDNGSVATITGGNQTWYDLPFSVADLPAESAGGTTGYLKLTGELTTTSTQTWASLGFTSDSGSPFYNTADNWLFLKSNQAVGFSGTGGIGTVVASATPVVGADYYQIELNLATDEVTFLEGTSLTDMTTVLGSGTYTVPVSGITNLQFEAQGGDGVQTWDNTQLAYSTDPTAVVPEPSAGLLLFGGLLGLLAFIRLRAGRGRA